MCESESVRLIKEGYYEGYRDGHEFPDELTMHEIEAAWQCSDAIKTADGRQY